MFFFKSSPLTQTYKQEYASARHIEPCRGLQKEKLGKAEYLQCRVSFVYLQLPLHENVVCCACMGNATDIMFIMWNSFSCLDT